MPSATASASEEALTDDGTGFGRVTTVLDAVTTPESDLPCRAGDADLWFAEAPAELERAKHLCGSCPVRASCLAGALARREPWGVWGGEIFERGAVVARKRPRGRPRKNADVAATTGQRSAA
ncbi:WhiB family transcriptional regulator [Saccharomonospora saliphila]|uniref:WhiB family transcriptional regulator n=1 Tax=Saccharomonospora saliphila TaxID=369829 RepID=UPI000381F355|nr:WhiB family transcriptional regulator [Saccharomonospora saliphila]